jgi:hypothetical protein
MRHVNLRLILGVSAIFLAMSIPGNCDTGSLSLTSTLATPESVFQQTFTLSAPSTLHIVTFNFGGGTNAAGQVFPPGGFDPLVALFNGPPATASIFVNAGNPAADADTLTNFVGNCPPAGTVVIGTGTGSVVCGDAALILTGVPAGTYTLVVTDANYIPLAVDPGPPSSTKLADGFLDLTGGVFQTCNITSNGTTCITPSNLADHQIAIDIVDVTGPFLAPPKPPILTKSFADAELQLFGPNTTALRFTITNPNDVLALTGGGFTDNLPAGLAVASPNGLTGSCGGGTITATAGSSSISVSGATLPPGASLAPGVSCTFSVNVTGTAIGVQTNTTSTVTSNEAAPGAPATATISVDFLYFYWFFAA